MNVHKSCLSYYFIFKNGHNLKKNMGYHIMKL